MLWNSPISVQGMDAATQGMDAAASSMVAASVELESCSNTARGESPVEVKRGGRKPKPKKGGKPASSSDGLGDKVTCPPCRIFYPLVKP